MSDVADTSPIEFGNKKLNRKKLSRSLWWCFTFNNYTEENIEHILLWFNPAGHLYIFQEELGKINKTRHLQGTVRFTSKCIPIENNKHINGMMWTKTRSVSHATNYCIKEETRNGRQWSNIPKEKPLKLISYDNMYAWQKEVLNLVSEIDADDRTIFWYWEEKGCTGKTALARYLCAPTSPVKTLCISGKSSDCKNGILQYFMKNNCFPECIIFNVPRSNIDYISYEAIESIKDGLFFSGKYEGGMVLMNSPYVFVFCNEEPHYEKLSKDRWRVVHLDNN